MPEAEPEGSTGIAQLKERIERRSRTVPPPRRPRESQITPPTKSSEPGSASKAPAQPSESPAVPEAASVTAVESKPQQPTNNGSERSAVPDPQVQLGVRIRQSLDEKLTDIVYALRKQGVRSSKAELVELLLDQMPDEPDEDLVDRIERSRSKALRYRR